MAGLTATFFQLGAEWMMKIGHATGLSKPPGQWDKFPKPDDTQIMASQPAQTFQII